MHGRHPSEITGSVPFEPETVNAEWDRKAAQTFLEDLKVMLEDQQSDHAGEIARGKSEYAQAVPRYGADSDLAKG